MCSIREILLVCFAVFIKGVSLVRLVSLNVPSHVVRGQEVRLECHFDLEGESLYSVKWYKDNREFYRFLPEDHPPAQEFEIPGFYIEMWNSTDTAVTLKRLDFNATGIYRCEVSGEAPSFRTVAQNGQMVIVDLPRRGPTIEGIQNWYRMGDIVRANCTSRNSRPAPHITWLVNDHVVGEVSLTRYPIQRDEDFLETSILGLQFQIGSGEIWARRNPLLRLKCVASIPNLFWKSREAIIDGPPPAYDQLDDRATYGKRAAVTGNSALKFSAHFLLIAFLPLLVQSVLVLLFTTTQQNRITDNLLQITHSIQK